METLKKLAIKHPYYASDSNFYSNEASREFDTMTEFLEEFKEADVDMNLVYRWDVYVQEEDDKEQDPGLGKYYAQVTIIHQRKGIYSPYQIKNINEEEVKQFIEYLKPHWDKLKEIWLPLSSGE